MLATISGFAIIFMLTFTIMTQFSYAELYNSNQYSFSIQYPDGWNVESRTPTQDDLVIVSFFDGAKESFVESSLWNSAITVGLFEDIGPKYSDFEEQQFLRDYVEDGCLNATYSSDGLICYDFEVIAQTSGFTINGYPAITILYSATTRYADLSGEFPQVLMETDIFVGNDIWAISSESDYDVFDRHKDMIADTMKSFKLSAFAQPSTSIPPPPPTQPQSSPSSGGGCLIATATFGSEFAPQVQQLREIRDNTLLKTNAGSSFMSGFNQLYYSFSPTIADWERENPVFKEAVKITITPLLSSLSLLNYVDIDTEAEMLGYGIGVILLNVGMYFVAPTVAIVKLKKLFLHE